ncbi:hypothetical protein [Brevibacterium sp. CT2-23B]|uniref:hypothetical protein n=1 Tax=Brevibacterium sp. CT2-23B TaxID=2729630 RepID=UPI001553643C|nr:hypothetical protein [Brevibacterium sp. CT2-23B]
MKAMVDEERIRKAVEEELWKRGVHEGLAPAVAPGASALTIEEHELDVAQLREELHDKFSREFAAEEESRPDESNPRN